MTATLSGTDLNTLTDPPNSFADNDVIQMVKDRITGQKVPAPNDNLLYCVIIPQFVPSTVPLNRTPPRIILKMWAGTIPST